MSLAQAFSAELDALAPGDGGVFDETVLVACSGGGDSTALLLLAQEVLGAGRVTAGSVQHNLRAEAQSEIDGIVRTCAQLGVSHQQRDWHWDGQGNLQAKARDARRALLQDMADDCGAVFILLGHTADDQAETVLMRLARGSGVDGLAGMPARSGAFLRPMLRFQRAELRDFLKAQGVDWSDDPSNHDPQFDRVRARQMAATLADLGLTQTRLVQTADLMRGESEALKFGLAQWAKANVTTSADGMVHLPSTQFTRAPATMQTRLLAELIRWFSGISYKPRRDDLDRWLVRLRGGTPTPLGGGMALMADGVVKFWREANAVPSPEAFSPHTVSTVWDNRWRVSQTDGKPGAHIGALGEEGLQNCPNWRELGLSRDALLTTPAIWEGDKLVAAPIAGLKNGYNATLRPSFAEFLDTH